MCDSNVSKNNNNSHDALNSREAAGKKKQSAGSECLGNYRIRGTLGKGGMGIVYRGENIHNGQEAAIKTVLMPDKDLLHNFRREIRALARIQHPGIVRVFDEGVSRGLPWYAMEMLPGPTLDSYFSTSLARSVSAGKKRPSDTMNVSGGAGDEDATGVIGSPPLTDHRDDKTGVIGSPPAPRYHSDDKTGIIGSPPITHHNDDKTGIIGSTLPPDQSFRASSQPGGAHPEAGTSVFSGDFSENVKTVLSMFYKLCLPLAYLHGEGMVHRDLKPENIVIRDDNSPVLVDFGLMSQFSGEISREVLDVDQMTLGTVSYMAPEQIRGDFSDARTDLYALGVIFYEIVVGHPPFVGTNVNHILHAHLTATPVKPSVFCPGIPGELDNLIMRLLEKKRRNRIGYADTIARMLAAMGADSPYIDNQPQPKTYLYRPELSGRKSEFEQLEHALQRLKQKTGDVFFVGGESGVGKTRLVMEIGKEAAHQEVTIITQECAKEGMITLGALRKFLQKTVDRCLELGSDETHRLMGRKCRLLADIEPLLKSIPGFEKYTDYPELQGEAAQIRLYQALLETFEQSCRDLPTLLIIDDIQWADELSWGFLHYLLRGRQMKTLPLLILATYRTDEIKKDYDEILSHSRAEKHILKRLDNEAVSDMVTAMLAIETPVKVFCDFLAHNSEGNPFFVAEYLRTAVMEEILWRDAEGMWNIGKKSGEPLTADSLKTIQLPTSVHDLVQRRLDELTDKSRYVVSSTAVFGRDCRYNLLREMLDMDETELLDALAELQNSQIVQEHEKGAFRFSHHKFKEVVYDGIAEEQIPDLHRRAATSIETIYSDDHSEFSGALGGHWEKAGENERACPYYLQGARQAKQKYAYDEAETLYGNYLNLKDTLKRDIVSIRNEFGSDIYQIQGKNAEAIEQHKEAYKASQKLNLQGGMASSLVFMGKAQQNMGLHAEARQNYETAINLFRSEHNKKQEGNALSQLALLHSQIGELDEAHGLYQQALKLHRQTESVADETETLHNLGILFHMQGKLDEASKLYERDLQRQRETSNLVKEGQVLGNLAILYSTQGNLEKAGEFYEKALLIHEKVGNRKDKGIILGNLAILQLNRGKISEAQALFEQALTIHREVNNTRLIGNTLGNLAYLYGMEKNYRHAVTLCEESLEIYKLTGEKRAEGNVLGNMALFTSLQGDVEKSWVFYEKSISILRDIDDKISEAIVLGWMTTLARRTDPDCENAQKYNDRALALLEELNSEPHRIERICEQGHIRLAQNKTAESNVSRARKLSAKLKIEPESDAGKAVRRLEKAQHMFDRGEQKSLLQGECIEDIPPGIYARLKNKGRLY